MMTIESKKPGLSACERMISVDMSNTGNLTPMDKSTFRWFRWIHRTNVYSVREVFFRWKINDVMTHGKQISVKLRLSDGSDGSDGSIGQASLL